MEIIEQLQEQTQRNTEAIAELAKSDAVQSEQIRGLAQTADTLSKSQTMLLNRLVLVVVVILVLTILALIFGALGKEGFNGVTKAAPSLVKSVGVDTK